MDAEIILLLESKNPQDRKKAIKLLAQEGGQDALRTLAGIYKYDPDPDIRALAVNAGKYIKKQQNALLNAVEDTYESEPEVEEVIEEEPEEDLSTVAVSKDNQARAKTQIETALDLLGRGEMDKATDSIIKAMRLNPNLRTDSYAIGVAIEVTGLDKKDILKLVAEGRTPKAERGKSGPKEKKQPKEGEWFPNPIEAILACIGCFLLWTALVSGASIVFINSVQSGFEMYEAEGCSGCTAEQQATLVTHMSAVRQFRNMTQNDFIPFAATLAAVTVGLAILFTTTMHYVGNYSFDGQGFYRPTLVGAMAFLGLIAFMWGLSILYISMQAHRFFDPQVLIGEEMVSRRGRWLQMLGMDVFVLFSLGAKWVQEAAKDYDYSIGISAVVCLIAIVPVALIGFLAYKSLLGPVIMALTHTQF